jgi:hypothetical protein
MLFNHKNTLLILGFGLGVGISSCSADTSPSPTASPSASPAASAQPASPAPAASPAKPKGKVPLTVEKLKNTEYYILAEGPIKLTNGKYEDKKKRVFTLGDVVAYGDLNRDGIKDAIVPLIITINGRNFTYLVGVLNQDGNPKNTSSDFLGEGIKVKTLSANAGKITVKMDKYASGDQPGHPSQTITREYQYKPFKPTQTANKDAKAKDKSGKDDKGKSATDAKSKPEAKPSPSTSQSPAASPSPDASPAN